MQEKIEDIKHIQNTIWAIYKSYLADHDMKKWNDGIKNLTRVRWLVITWCPIINGFAEEFRRGDG